ncbi:MAG: DnaD domain protein [Acholeplasmataceae bacterium]|jgi:replication initiation and membrane attachment protein|nr:DnaD domain protein [Acholeplasmataceae bacterium]MDD4194309.1 DnaD domain protein [Acholeplasmataceae bacterium]MDY0339442.1 DnaD domain protein [Acholeplasmataceae bacterium]
MKNSSLFQLHSSSDLSAQDFKVLALLYQPLMGLDAHALYTTFYQLLNKTKRDTYTHNELFDLLNIRQSEYLKVRQKLEALNLIEVYKKEDHFIYYMKAPLSAKQFLMDTVFGAYLQSEIGEKNLNFVTSLFKMDIPEKEGYDNITKSFDALYEFKSSSLLNIDYPLQGRQQNGGSHINYKFNYENFVERVPERLKNTQLLSERFKDIITKIAFVYQFDVSDMVQIYETATKSKQNINFSQLNLKAKQYYDSKHQMLSIAQKDLPKTTLMDQIAPQVIIQKYAKTNQQGIALQTATNLLERNHVEPGIINVILMLVLKNKDGVLPNINYLETVLHDWLNKGVQTTEDAINYATDLETKWEKKPTTPSKSEPDWLDDYIKDLANMEG